MKVCLICSQIAAWGKIGGFGTNTRLLGRGLARAGLEVHVVVPRRPGQARTEQLDGMTVHGQSVGEVFAGQQLYRDIDADIFHAEEPTISAYWAQKARPDKIHLVTCMDPRDRRDWWIELCNATWPRRAKMPMQWIYEAGPLVRRAVSAAHGVYVEAEFLKAKARRLYALPRDPGLLPKPIEIPAGPFVKSERPLCAFIGRLDPRKRPKMVLELARRMPEVRFVMVGQAHDAGYQRHLERLAAGTPNLELVGFVDPFVDDRLHRILDEAWMLIQPAAREGLPTAFQEASVREVAIVAFVDPAGYVSRFGAVAEERRGVDGLERAVRALIRSGAWHEKAKAGRRYNAEHHALDVSVRRHLEVYREQQVHGGRGPEAWPQAC
ncbi:MAG: glycosyltransferase family 4 protein [Geminicoccaceae bacterium]|nr:glycosyltransferase family 4 protein [Geminicoccaceae bacterium]